MAEFQVNLATQGVPANRAKTLTCDTLKFDKVAWAEATAGLPVRFIHVDGRHTPGISRTIARSPPTMSPMEGSSASTTCGTPSYPLLPHVVHMFLPQRPHFVVFYVLDRESIVGAGKYLICRRRWGKRYVPFLQRTFRQYDFVPRRISGSTGLWFLRPKQRGFATECGGPRSIEQSGTN
jgi:hypothetical protein